MATPDKKQNPFSVRVGCLFVLFVTILNFFAYGSLRGWFGSERGWSPYVAAALCSGIAVSLAFFGDHLISRMRHR